MAKGKDWTLRTVYFCSAVSFAAALVLALMFFWQPSNGFVYQQLAHIPLLKATIWPTAAAQGLQGWEAAYAMVVSLLLLAVILCLVARRRAINNYSLWPSAGCPDCQEDSLVRVHRRRQDRILALSGIPLARYLCLECGWKGRRTLRGPMHLKNMIGPHELAPAIYPTSRKIAKATAQESPLRAGLEPKNGLDDPESVQSEDLFSPDNLLWQRPRQAQAATLKASRQPEHADLADTGLIIGTHPVKLREHPRAGARESVLLAPGTVVQLLDAEDGKARQSWQYVAVNDHKGWIMTMFLKRMIRS